MDGARLGAGGGRGISFTLRAMMQSSLLLPIPKTCIKTISKQRKQKRRKGVSKGDGQREEGREGSEN